MKWGYGRVSTPKQAMKGNSLDEQTQALRDAGVPEQNIVVDQYTGKKMDRPNFTRLLEKLQSGDTLVVTKMDRFARTATEGGAIVKALQEKGVIIHILNMGVLDDTAMGRLISMMLLAFAEFERDMIVERTQAGRDSAREKGVRVDGRPPKFPKAQLDHAMDLLSQHSYSEVARMTGISRSTLTREKRRRNTNNRNQNNTYN